MHGSASTVRDVNSDARPVHTEAIDSNSEARSLQLSSVLSMHILYYCKEDRVLVAFAIIKE